MSTTTTSAGPAFHAATADHQIAELDEVPDTEIVSAYDLGAGDLITEVDTPDGPFYRVFRTTRDAIEVDGDPFGERALYVTLPVRETDKVRRAVSA